MSTQYENIYYNQSRVPGKVRLNKDGLGWKASDKASGGSATRTMDPVVVAGSDIQTVQWSRGSKGNELRVQTKNSGVMRLDGFDEQDHKSLENALKHELGLNLEVKDHSMRGWNWGKMDFERSEMVFNVANKPAFEIPYSEVSNSNLVNKSEVAVEFDLQEGKDRTKIGDELVEMRFYVPGTVAKDDNEEGDNNNNNNDDENEEDEEESAASVFYEGLKERAEIGAVAGEAIAAFSDVYFLTPRGRYDIDMYRNSFRLRGKSYDYKLQYSNVQRIFCVPKPDGNHHILALQVDPPLRQGQTRYPFLVGQFQREETMEIELNLEEEEYEANYKDKLKMKYDEAAHLVVANVFRGLTEKKVTFPSSYVTQHGESGISCSNKASEGYIYPLEKGILFTPKPTLYLPWQDIQNVTFSRLDGSNAGRTFDMTVKMRGGSNNTSHQFSNIEREEQSELQKFIKTKNISIKDDDADREQKIARARMDAVEESDEEMPDRGSAAEDSESEDGDFGSDDAEDSDVAEEFDEDHQTDSGDSDDDEEQRAKKKAKN